MRIAAAVKKDHAEVAQLLMEASNCEALPIVVIMDAVTSGEHSSSCFLPCPVRLICAPTADQAILLVETKQCCDATVPLHPCLIVQMCTRMLARCPSQGPRMVARSPSQSPLQPGPQVSLACTRASSRKHHFLHVLNIHAAYAGRRLRRMPVVRRFARGFESNQAAWDAFWADHKAPVPLYSSASCLHANSLRQRCCSARQVQLHCLGC